MHPSRSKSSLFNYTSTDNVAVRSYNALVSVGVYSFLLSLDTASSDMWLVSSDCTSEACKNVPTYPAQIQSPTFTAVNGNATEFSISFADTTAATGFVASEAINIAGFKLPAQPFGEKNNGRVW